MVKLLWASGVLAVVAVAFPFLMYIGMFFGVGFVLVAAPTVFLYVGTFVLARKLLPMAAGARVNAAAATITVVLGFAVTAPFAISGRLAFAAAATGDIVPATPIAIAGDVRLERHGIALPKPRPKDGLWDCDALCAALLDTPLVRSVTLAGTDEAGAPLKPATFRLVAKADAPSGGLAPREPGKIIEHLPNPEQHAGKLEAQRLDRDARRRALIARWTLRLAGEATLVREAATGNADLTIAIDDTRAVGLHRLSVAQVELRNSAGQVLFRRQKIYASVVTLPFYMEPQGGMLDGGFGVGRDLLYTGDRYATFKPIEILFSEAGLAEPRLGTNAADMRERLAAALARPERSADLDLAAAWTTTLDWRKIDEPDIALLAQLIRDRRITALDRIYENYGMWVSPRLREAVIARLLDPATPQPLRHRLDEMVRTMPRGTFAVLTADERALLANQQLRLASAAIVARLADGGADATPLLLEILQADVQVEPWDKRQAVMASLCRAFTRLGPDAAAALPVVERLFAQARSPLMSFELEESAWRVAMVRMGKPVEELSFPTTPGAESVERAREAVRRSAAQAAGEARIK